MNLGHLDFDIVSNFVLRISYFSYRDTNFPSTSVEKPLQISSFLTNKANFPESQMNVTKLLTKDYKNKTLGGCGKNKANSKPNKANLLNARMDVTVSYTKEYENKSNWALFENKPNTKPISEAKKMHLRLTFNGRRNSFGYYADEIEAPNAEPVRLRWNRAAKKYRILHSVFPKKTNFSLFIFGYQLESRFWTFKLV